ncbi:hypothetical protein MP228_006306 [Amoeboaphelidium protococcarum]|nr:hypothetical protein MP228_006306 [Amoeboaphelidium protococcarum]
MKYLLATAFAALIAPVYGHPHKPVKTDTTVLLFQSFDTTDCSGPTDILKLVVASANKCTLQAADQSVVSLQTRQFEISDATTYEVKTYNGADCKSESAVESSQISPVVQGNYTVGQCVSADTGSTLLFGTKLA